MKKILFLLLFIILTHHSAYSQTSSKFKFSGSVGIIGLPGFGLLADIEPKYYISSNSSVGIQLRILGVMNRETYKPDRLRITSYGYSALSTMATYEKCLGKEKSKFQPFLGGGVGYFKASGEDDILLSSDSEYIFFPYAEPKGQIGFTIRTGFEINQFRLGLDYNIIPKSDLILNDGRRIAAVMDSYLSLSFGFTFGIGK